MNPGSNPADLQFPLDKYIRAVEEAGDLEETGVVSEVIGLTITSAGPRASVGDICLIYPRGSETAIRAEVVGFREKRLILMPFGGIDGIGPGSVVRTTGTRLRVGVGSALLGRVLNGLGQAIDGKGPVRVTDWRQVENTPPSPLRRCRINQPLAVGIRAIDGLVTIGRGQRMGIFAGSGVGKSTLLGMIARNTDADVSCVALIGERGREVREFLERDLGEKGMARSVVVAATSDQPALVRLKGAFVATTIAEYFREQGLDVLFMMDSVTRFAAAQREIGLAVGEPPATKGYTPSVFAQLPKLLERTGTGEQGTITGLYTVLVDGDDLSDPVADAVRSILDGHIVLDRRLAEQRHYPAIDVLASVSRVMDQVVDEQQAGAARVVKSLLGKYREMEDLINIGAYVSGSNRDVDTAIAYIDKVNSFLQQGMTESPGWSSITGELEELANQITGR